MKTLSTIRRRTSLVTACLISVLSLAALAGCGDDTDDPPPNPSTPPPATPAPVPRAD